MAALTANSVAYTVQGRGGSVDDNGVRQNNIKIVFGDAASTYPAGGIPLTNLVKWGFPANDIGSVIMLDPSSSDGYLYKYSKANNSIRIYQSPASAGLAALTEATTSFVPANGVTLYIQVRGH